MAVPVRPALCAVALLLAACRRQPPPPAPARPPSPPPPVDAAPAAPADPERDYQAAMLDYDRGQLPLFTEVLARVDEALAAYEPLASRRAARKEIDAVAAAHEAALAALEKRIDALDATRSRIAGDLQMLLYDLKTGLPDALREHTQGRAWPLGNKRASIAERRTEIDHWLTQVRSGHLSE